MINRKELEAVLRGIAEHLASIEHERWSHWQNYMHEQGQKQADGSLVIPAELVSRWEQQASTSYADLTEREKDSDREQVARYLPVIADALAAKRQQ
jgi:hypothetical protein